MSRRGGLNFRKKKKKLNVSLLKEVFIWAGEILLSAAIAVVLVIFFGLRISTVGVSMSPTLEAGDEVLVNRFIYQLTAPKQGDIIVFKPNGNAKSHYYIKRVIAVSGDTVQISDGLIYVNGEVYMPLDDATSIEDAGVASDEITLGTDEYFVLGDNFNNSEDSRYANIGNIKKEYIVGKVWFVLTRGERFGFLE